jgi:hypothetical protein
MRIRNTYNPKTKQRSRPIIFSYARPMLRYSREDLFENINKPSEGFFQTNHPVGKSTLAVLMRFYAQAIVIAITFYILS